MTPAELAKKNSESGHQKAVFAWAAVAAFRGFAAANDPLAYNDRKVMQAYPLAPVEELKWLHSIPNGGARDAVTAARMKAEGARRGVYDIFLPVARSNYHGLYIEMKKPGDHAVSPEQFQFGQFASAQGYAAIVCIGWEAAVRALENYMKGARDYAWTD